MNKTRKHPNFFDILIVLLLILVAGAAWVISHRDNTQGEAVLRRYTIELTDLEETMADSVQVGDKVTDNIKNYDIGTVAGVEVLPYTQGVVDEENAVIRQQPMPGSIRLLVTVECLTVEGEKEIATTSGYTLRTGTSVSISAGELTSGGYILTVER